MDTGFFGILSLTQTDFRESETIPVMRFKGEVSLTQGPPCLQVS